LAPTASPEWISPSLSAAIFSTPRSTPRKSVVGIGDRHQQEPLAVAPEHEVALALGPAEPLGLIGAHEERHDHPADQGANADAIRPLEADVLAHRVGHGGVRAEVRPHGLVPLVRLDDLRDAADRHVGGEAEPRAKLGIGDLLEDELVAHLPRERHPGQPLRRRVEPLDGRRERRGLIGVGQESGLEGELHAHIILGIISPIKSGAAIPPSRQRDGPLAGFLVGDRADLLDVERWLRAEATRAAPPAPPAAS
jgi:hypothetical protein